MNDNNQIIDLPELLERVQDDRELLLELFDIFMEDYKGKRIQLQEAITKKDYENIRGIVHSLKGASGNISAKPVRDVSMRLEAMGKNNTIEGAEQALGQLDVEYEKMVQCVGEIRKEFGAA